MTQPTSIATFCAFVMLALAALTPYGLAGTSDAPEISDSPSDSTSPDPGRDIAQMWIEPIFDADEPSPNPAVLRFHLEVAAEFVEHLPAFFALHEDFRIGFTMPHEGALPTGAVEGYVSIRPSSLATSGSTQKTLACAYGRAAETGGYEELTAQSNLGSADHEGKVYVCDLPLSLLNLDSQPAELRLTELYVSQRLITRGPLSGGDDIPPTQITEFDRAPDSDFGTDFVIPLIWPVEAEDLGETFSDLVGDSIGFEEEFADPVTGVRHFNWTTDANAVTVDVDAVVGAGTASFDLRDSFDQSVLSGTFTANFTASEVVEAVAPGDWTLKVEYESFVGSLGIDVTPVTACPSEEQSGGSPPGPGGAQPENPPMGLDTSAQGADSEEDCPGEGQPGEPGTTPPGEPTPTNGSSTPTPTDGGDGGDSEKADKGSPGPATVLVMLAMLGVALFVRRKTL